jgi:hypothetical protein
LRISLVDVHYPAFLRNHYERSPELSTASSAEQLRSLMATGFGKGDSYSRHLRAAGHEVDDVIANCFPLQAQWARENDVSPSGLEWADHLPRGVARRARSVVLRRLALDRIERFAPDVIYLFDLNFFRLRQLDRLRRPGRLLAGQIASRAPAIERLRRYELLVTSFPHYVERFRAAGINAEYLPIAFQEDLVDRLRGIGVDTAADSPRSIPVSFVGGLGGDAHGGGTALLERLAQETELHAWGYGVERLPAGSPLRAAHRGEAFGLDMYRVLADSKIVVNRHIDAAEGHANNMRLYEATGAGALLLTEAAPNLPELFEPGREVVTYDGVEDLVAKVRHFVANDDERVRIAAAGQARTLAEHTYARRVPELEAILGRHVRRVAVT